MEFGTAKLQSKCRSENLGMHSDFSVFKIKSRFLSEFQSDPSMSEESLQFSLHHMKKQNSFSLPWMQGCSQHYLAYSNHTNPQREQTGFHLRQVSCSRRRGSHIERSWVILSVGQCFIINKTISKHCLSASILILAVNITPQAYHPQGHYLFRQWFFVWQFIRFMTLRLDH